MSSGSRRVLRSLLLLVGALASAACAQGATIDDAFRSSGSGDGGDTGDGGSGNEGGSQGDGGANGTTSGSSTSGTTTSSVSSGTTSSSSASSTSVSVSSSATTTVASSSSSSGGGADCDPLNPGPECGANQACFPAEQGDPTCEPAGSSGVYDACFGPGECAPTTACIDVGDPFAFPCCLLFCRSTPDCGGAGDCYFFETPVYANGVEFGVCFDGLSGC